MNNENINVVNYVDQFGNPIDPSLIDANGNYIGAVDNSVNQTVNQTDQTNITTTDTEENVDQTPNTLTLENNNVSQSTDASYTSMVTFDYNSVPISDIVNSIILDSINKNASDIHFDPFDDGIKIRIRIDGILHDYSIVPLYVKKNMITRIKIISSMNITESRVPQDGAIRTELNNKTIDLRVSCLPTNMGEKIVIRIMDYSMSAKGIEALDFTEDNLEKVKKMISLPNGIILVTGATGSGKSTTVYSMLQRINTEDVNLITVEDPIEMNIGGINQVQAQSEIGLDFATVLRSILRQDPDVIMIGEIRDDETARIAVRASITGHLVLSTIHTNNSLNTIERLTDMSVERYLLGTSLGGVISQKLSRRLCPKCKKLRPTTDYEKKVFKTALNQDVQEIYEPVGCNECSRGYRGRIAIHEVLLINQEIKDAIIKNVSKMELRKLVYGKGGSCTMLQDGLQKVVSGITSFEEILKLIDLEDDLGTNSRLGFDTQMQDGTNNTQAEGNQNININLTADLIEGLTGIKNTPSNQKNAEEEDYAKLDSYLDEINDKLSIIQTSDETNRKKYNLNIQETVSSLKGISKELVKFDKEILFSNDKENEIKNKIISIISTLSELKIKDALYENTIKRISNIIEEIKSVLDYEIVVVENKTTEESNNKDESNINVVDEVEIPTLSEENEENTNESTIETKTLENNENDNEVLEIEESPIEEKIEIPTLTDENDDESNETLLNTQSLDNDETNDISNTIVNEENINNNPEKIDQEYLNDYGFMNIDLDLFDDLDFDFDDILDDIEDKPEVTETEEIEILDDEL